MGSEAEPEPSYKPKLPLFLIPPQSPEPSGMLTPPLHSSVSVPFRWEEEPGKPRPCTALTLCNSSEPKCLDLPPRLLIMESKITKLPSPTTVLDGPYVGRSVFQSSSFRFIKEREGSFRGSGRMSPQRGHLGTMILSKRGHKERRFFGSWGKRTLKVKSGGGGGGTKKEGGGDSFVFSSSMDMATTCGDEESCSSGDTVKMTSFRRNGSLSSSSLSQARSHFWTAMYKGFKQVIPWSRKSKKEAVVVI